MGYSTRKVAARSVQPDQGGYPGEDDPHDAIEREFLGLWLGLARLREQVLGGCRRRPVSVAVKPGKPATGKKPRRRAA
jgi:hypothetical protein